MKREDYKVAIHFSRTDHDVVRQLFIQVRRDLDAFSQIT